MSEDRGDRDEGARGRETSGRVGRKMKRRIERKGGKERRAEGGGCSYESRERRSVCQSFVWTSRSMRPIVLAGIGIRIYIYTYIYNLYITLLAASIIVDNIADRATSIPPRR